MDRDAGLSPQRQGAAIGPGRSSSLWQFGVAVPLRVSHGTAATSADCVVSSMPHTWESNMKLVTIAAIAALTATPVLADPIQEEQSRRITTRPRPMRHTPRSRRKMPRPRPSRPADAASSQAQANAAQADGQQPAGPRQCGADRRLMPPRNQANASQAQADSAQTQADQASGRPQCGPGPRRPGPQHHRRSVEHDR